MKNLNLLVIFCVCYLLSSCASIVAFTDDIAAQVGGENRLGDFQYYVSRTIVLDKVEDSTDASLTAGKANLVRTIKRDKITVKESTPGVVITHQRIGAPQNIATYNLGVAFEADDNDLLKFKRRGVTDKLYYIETEINDWVNYGGNYYKYSTPIKRKWLGLGVEKKLPPPYLMIKLNKNSLKSKLNERQRDVNFSILTYRQIRSLCLYNNVTKRPT